MTIHANLSNAELHEAKGAAGASKGELLTADGGGAAAFSLLLNNVVHVNVLADLPSPSGGFITLAAATTYLFGANINIGTDYLKFSAGSDISAAAAFTSTITYTGTVPMLQGADVNATIKDITLICASSDAYSWADTGGGGNSIIIISDVLIIACLTVGTFDDINTLVINGMTVVSCTDGLVLLGDSHVGLRLVSLAMLSTDTGYVGIDLTSATMKTVNIDGVILVGGAGSIGIKGDAASANITTGFIANVSNTQFTGVTTTLSGITVDDIRWNFQANGVVQDTMADSLLSMTSNTTDTVLAVGVPSLVLGTWVDERSSHFTNTAAGRATYDGERDLLVPVDADVTVEPVSGTNKSIRLFLALNGTVITDSGRAILLDTNNPRQINIHWQLNLSTTDYVELYIENETDSVDVTVIDATLRLR